MWTQMDADGRRYKSKSKIRFSSAFICVHLCLISFVFAFPAYATETITVAVASSLYAEMQKQAKAFEKEHDVNIRLVSGSTGRLYNQIMQGAPFDAFIAADSERPARLAEQGKVFAQYNVGQGYLGLMRGHEPMTDLKQLTDPSIRHIAIANPDVAPFGKVSKSVLQKHKLWQRLKAKFVYAQNAMQATMMVNKGLVDAGFVAVAPDDAFLATLPYVGVLLIGKQQAHNFMQELKQNHLRLIASGGATLVAQKTCHASETKVAPPSVLSQ